MATRVYGKKGSLLNFISNGGKQPPRPAKKPDAMNDLVFFSKSQIHLGSYLVCMGRLDPRSVWIVASITHYTNLGSRKKTTVATNEDRVTGMRDQIILRRAGSNETRSGTFQYFSYSAIWRLDI